jgi:hypothetical protein
MVRSLQEPLKHRVPVNFWSVEFILEEARSDLLPQLITMNTEYICSRVVRPKFRQHQETVRNIPGQITE